MRLAETVGVSNRSYDMFRYLSLIAVSVSAGFAGGFITSYAIEPPNGADRFFAAQADEQERQKELRNAWIDRENALDHLKEKGSWDEAWDRAVGNDARTWIDRQYEETVAEINAKFGYHSRGR